MTPVRQHVRIVAVGGGTGLPAVLRGLKSLLFTDHAEDSDRLVAVVAVTDDGGSSGRLREELKMLPPGDLRNFYSKLGKSLSPLGSHIHTCEGTSRCSASRFPARREAPAR